MLLPSGQCSAAPAAMVRVDSATDIPADVYKEFYQAGRQARRHTGQHTQTISGGFFLETRHLVQSQASPVRRGAAGRARGAAACGACRQPRQPPARRAPAWAEREEPQAISLPIIARGVYASSFRSDRDSPRGKGTSFEDMMSRWSSAMANAARTDEKNGRTTRAALELGLCTLRDRGEESAA
ncbi:unnamed protein product [Prorocentrum cordatum]|uniref:Uncharacterized protein n=1 Tax=Prorocentrum cordatum TaxID=2364126 RepID=A0ABN9QHA0_9DINO|nr:unnamed protein product [Polarella glacialis]